MSEYDLVVRNGTIVDGSGNAGYRGDVAVRAGHIVDLGHVGGSGTTEIDATDRVVAPGFVDVHTHLDVQLFWDRGVQVSPWHGVTTVMMGCCGFGIAPTRPEHREWLLRTLQHVEGMDYTSTSAGIGHDWGFESFGGFLDAVERRNLAINSAALVGLTALKTYVMGMAAGERIATDDEHRRIKALATEAIRAGAIGFSSSQSDAHFGEGGLPVPSRVVTEDQLVDLCGALNDAGAGILQFGTGRFLSDALFERIVESVPGHHVHGHGLYVNNSGIHLSRLAHHAELNARGFLTHPEFICLPMQFEASMLDPFMPFVDVPPQLGAQPCTEVMSPVLSLQSAGERMEVYRSAGFRDRLRDAASGPGWPTVWSAMTFTEVPGHLDLGERCVADVAKERGVHPVDLLLDLQIEAFPEEPRFNIGFYNFDEDEVAKVLANPLTVPGNSDAGAHVRQICDARWPTHLLGRFVRERGDLTLPQAIRKMSYQTAQSIGITDRGLLARDWRADLVVFDPDTVHAGPLERRFDFPAGGSHLVSEPIGIDHVVVNGTPIRAHGQDLLEPDGPMPGTVLRDAARTVPVAAR